MSGQLAPCLQKFLGHLPLVTDSTEAQAAHLMLFRQIIAANPNLMQAD